MSIASTITAMASALEDAYDAIDTKGGTIPQSQTMVNLSTAIASIPQSGGADVSGVTATAGDVLTGKDFVSSNGTLVHGSMANRGAINGTVDGINTTSYSVQNGYHNGNGVVTFDDSSIVNIIVEILGDKYKLPLAAVYNNINSITGTFTVTYDDGDTATYPVTLQYEEGDYDRDWYIQTQDDGAKFYWYELDSEVYAQYGILGGAYWTDSFYLGDYETLFG